MQRFVNPTLFQNKEAIKKIKGVRVIGIAVHVFNLSYSGDGS
jgi:hypothetical protein